jgi:hypothetical protein
MQQQPKHRLHDRLRLGIQDRDQFTCSNAAASSGVCLNRTSQLCRRCEACPQDRIAQPDKRGSRHYRSEMHERAGRSDDREAAYDSNILSAQLPSVPDDASTTRYARARRNGHVYDLGHSRDGQHHENDRGFITERNVIRQNQTRRVAAIGEVC